MQKKFRKIKIRVFMTTLTFFLATGCSLQRENLDSKLQSDYLYYSRNSSKEALPSDFILTLEEKGISPLSDYAKNIISKISKVNTYLFDFSWTDLFEIEKYYYFVYTDPNIVTTFQNHTYTNYYNKHKDTILWSELVNKIYENSLIRVQQDKDLLKDKETIKLYKGLKELEKGEIKIVLKQLQDFTSDVKKQYPDYDMAHFACQLSNLALTYRTTVNECETGILATTSSFEIQWYLNDSGQYPFLNSSILLNEHEFKHLLCGYCIDDLQDDCHKVPSGAVYGDYEGLRFSFIEEVTAEEYSTVRNNLPTVTYYEKKEIVDNLRFILSMQKDYEEDGFLKYSFLKDPLAMVQQFPVLEGQEYYFVDILKMLASYNAVLTNSYEFNRKVRNVSGYEDFNKDLKKQKEVYSSLTNYAQLGLERLFFTNLIVMNEENEDMTLQYNFYLMRLFEKRSQIAYDAINDYQKMDISSANYWQAYEENLGFLFQYLSSRYHLENKDIRDLYKEYSLSEGVVYPNFIDKNRIQFYEELGQREYDAKTLKENLEEKIKSYVDYESRK